MLKSIYIYKDEGCVGEAKIEEWLKRHMPSSVIQYVSADDIRSGILQDGNPKAFFIGGGESRYYNAKLRKTGKNNIKRYVYNGGTIFGICAGSAYLASKVQYKEHGKKMNKVISLNERQGQLGLFNGSAVFDIRDFRGDNDFRNIAQVRYGKNSSVIYYYKGPYFDGLGDSDKELARFGGLTSHSAAVKTKFGYGVAVSCAIHPETMAEEIISNEVRVGISNPNLKTTQEAIDGFSRFILIDLLKQDLTINLKAEDKDIFCSHLICD